uniref:Uncharacterized protein n=1 Tax=Parascaris univalens TaxID=6257 RepID=A0A914ZT06_PARUN
GFMYVLTLLVVASSTVFTYQKAVTNVTTINTSIDKFTTTNAVTINLEQNEDDQQKALEQGNQEHISGTTVKVPIINTLIDHVTKAKNTKLGLRINKIHQMDKNETSENVAEVNSTKNPSENMKEIAALSMETQKTIANYFDSIAENILKQLYAVFVNEESSLNDIKIVLDKFIVVLNESQRNQFDEILSNLESIVALRKKLFSKLSAKAKEAIKRVDASRMDEISTLMKLDYPTRVEVISYYKKIADIKNALMSKVRHLRHDVLESKERNNEHDIDESDEAVKKDREIHSLITPSASLEHEKNTTVETKQYPNEEKTKDRKKFKVNDGIEHKIDENSVDRSEKPRKTSDEEEKKNDNDGAENAVVHKVNQKHKSAE